VTFVAGYTTLNFVIIAVTGLATEPLPYIYNRWIILGTQNATWKV